MFQELYVQIQLTLITYFQSTSPCILPLSSRTMKISKKKTKIFVLYYFNQQKSEQNEHKIFDEQHIKMKYIY